MQKFINKKGRSVTDQDYRSLLVRFRFTLFILFIYVFCRNIYLPFLDFSKLTQGVTNYADISLGSSIQGSILGLGLSPWMVTVILFRAVSLMSIFDFKSMPSQAMKKYMYATMFFIASIQAASMLRDLPLTNESILIYILNFILLVLGAFFIVGMGNLNTEKGIGGISVLFLLNILSQWQGNILSFLFTEDHIYLAIPLLIATLLMIFIHIFFNLSKYHSYVNRSLIHNEFNKRSYLELSFLGVGGMPIMYGMGLLSIFHSFLQVIEWIIGKHEILTTLIEGTNIYSWTGLSIYCVLLISLSLLLTIDLNNPSTIAEDYLNNGDFIEGICPGEDTEKYLRKIIIRFGLFNAIYVLIFSASFIGMAIPHEEYHTMSMFPGALLFLVSIVIAVLDEMKGYFVKERYTRLF